jgi:uncharacterized protein (TIGR02996 family)
MARKAASSAEDAFLQAILDSPDNDIPRLVFADWLEEQGNPRGAFIRLQCQRAKMTRYDPGWKDILAQESAIFKQFDAEWSKPVLRLADAIEYRRGFIEHVRVSATKLLRNADRLFRIAPVCSIRLDHVDRLAEIGQAKWLARVRELDMSQNPLGHRSLRALFESEHCRSLRLLRLTECALDFNAVRVIAGEANLGNLLTLNLSANGIGAEGAQALARSPSLVNLQELSLQQNDLQVTGATALATAPTFHLRRLALGHNRIANDGAAMIASCPQFEQLRYLDLQSNGLGNPSIVALCESPCLQRLEHLNLYHNLINSRGVQMLSASSLLGNLSYLNLGSNEIDRATMQTLPQRLKTDKMRELIF